MEKTSAEFLEGFVFQFPDFDDAALNEPNINFKDPNGFFTKYSERYPDTWSAVSWEYASILELWKAAVEKAGSVEPMPVFEAMKAGGRAPHAFGDSAWWGKELDDQFEHRSTNSRDQRQRPGREEPELKHAPVPFCPNSSSAAKPPAGRWR